MYGSRVTVAALCQEIDRNNHVGQSQPPRVGYPKTCKVLLVGSVSCHHTMEPLCHGSGSNGRGPIWDGKHEVQVPSSGLNRPREGWLALIQPSSSLPTFSVPPILEHPRASYSKPQDVKAHCSLHCPEASFSWFPFRGYHFPLKSNVPSSL